MIYNGESYWFFVPDKNIWDHWFENIDDSEERAYNDESKQNKDFVCNKNFKRSEMHGTSSARAEE